MDKKVLFLDMDGTTLDDGHQMPEENIGALRRAMEAEHEVVITTGRPTASAKFLLHSYGLDQIGCRYVIAFNGGVILDCETGEVIFSQTMPLEQVKELALQARKAGVYFQTYQGNDVVAERDDENLAQYMQKTGMRARPVRDLTEALTEEPCKALIIDLHDRKPLLAFAEQMKEWAADKVDMYFSCAEYMEIVPKGISKGNAVQAFCRKFGIPLEQTIAVGDENNDISMIRVAGVGCAVANALEHVKAEADYVTERDNNHSAVAEVVERFMLNEIGKN